MVSLSVVGCRFGSTQNYTTAGGRSNGSIENNPGRRPQALCRQRVTARKIIRELFPTRTRRKVGRPAAGGRRPPAARQSPADGRRRPRPARPAVETPEARKPADGPPGGRRPAAGSPPRGRRPARSRAIESPADGRRRPAAGSPAVETPEARKPARRPARRRRPGKPFAGNGLRRPPRIIFDRAV
jgi:hypothetical protein